MICASHPSITSLHQSRLPTTPLFWANAPVGRSGKIANNQQFFAKPEKHRNAAPERTGASWKAKQSLGKKPLIRYRIAMHTVAVLALHGVLVFDLSTPVEVFGRARLPDGRGAYSVRVCAPAGEVDAGVFGMPVPWGLDALSGADTIIVPGLADPTAPVSEDDL